MVAWRSTADVRGCACDGRGCGLTKNPPWNCQLHHKRGRPRRSHKRTSIRVHACALKTHFDRIAVLPVACRSPSRTWLRRWAIRGWLPTRSAARWTGMSMLAHGRSMGFGHRETDHQRVGGIHFHQRIAGHGQVAGANMDLADHAVERCRDAAFRQMGARQLDPSR